MKERRELIKILKTELGFLNSGASEVLGRWRVPLTFEVSAICPNVHPRNDYVSCSACPLAQFVPPDLRNHRSACQYIPLNDKGETLNLLQSWGTPNEIERAIRDWLNHTIRRLEDEEQRTRPALQDGIITDPARLLPMMSNLRPEQVPLLLDHALAVGSKFQQSKNS